MEKKLAKTTSLILLVATMVMVTSAVAHGAGRDVQVPVGSTADEGFATSWETKEFRHDLFSAALAKHVDASGMIDYDAMRTDRNFQEYLYRLASTQPDQFRSDDARLAYWINAYNAFAIQGVLETLPRSRNKWSTYRVIDVKVSGAGESGKGFFSGLRFMAGGQRYSLDEIEKSILLQRVDESKENRTKYRSIGVNTPDPRIHFALVCAAKGCVKLRQKAYEAGTVDEQLNEAVRGFVEDQMRIRFDRQGKKINTNELLKWYEGDFVNPRYAPRAVSLTKFLAKFVTDSGLAKSLGRDEWKISYFDYDWTLNLQR